MGAILAKLDPLVKKFIKKDDDTIPINKEGVSYSEIRESLKSFDLVLFKGPSFVSDFIRYAEKLDASFKNRFSLDVKKDAFSHIGFIIRGDVLDDERLDDNGVYIFESTMSGFLGEGVYNLDGKPFLGMQIRDFDEVIKAYDSDPQSRIAIATIDPEIIFSLGGCRFLSCIFPDIFYRYEGVKYDWNAYSLLSSLFKCLRPGRDEIEDIFGTQDWLFCSEAVASIYVDLGILPKSVDPKNVVPMDFVGYDDEELNEGGIPKIIAELTYIVAD